MKAPPPVPAQAQSLSPCHAVPFLYPPRLTASNPQICSSKSFLVSRKLSFSLSSNKRTWKLPCGDTDNPRSKDQAASFLDEKGAVEDMDGYLNYLSLEYDSVWDTKPSWCQPWTIVTTGLAVITGSWLILRSLVVTSVVLSLICAWWYIFLFSYPKAYSDMIADRRNRVRSGVEDTYGSGRP